MTKIKLLFSLILSISLNFHAQITEQEQIEQTLNHYIDGFYKGDADKLKAVLKPRLYKFGYLKNKNTGDYEYYQHMNFDQAISFAEKMKSEGRSRDENTIRKTEVLDISNHIASAKVTAVWGVDYILLSKDEGKWMIEEVIWEGPYIEKERTLNTTTYYLIRHAEKDRSDANNNDPKLTETGLKRAKKWTKIFENISFDAVYSTNYQRTLETAQPTASAKNLSVIIFSPDTLDMKAFYEDTKGKTILIVGHSNTTPFFANALVGEKVYDTMDDKNNGGLYVVTITKDAKTSALLQMD